MSGSSAMIAADDEGLAQPPDRAVLRTEWERIFGTPPDRYLSPRFRRHLPGTANVRQQEAFRRLCGSAST